MHPSQSGHARRSHHTRSSNLSPPPNSASEPPPLQPSRSETAYRHLNPFGPTQTQQKPSLAQNQSSFEVLSAPTKKVKPDQHNFTENVHGAPHGVRFSEDSQLKKQGHEMYTDQDEHDYQLKISSLKHLIGEGQHIKPQDVLQKGRHLPQDMDSVWNTRPNLQGLSQFSDEKNRFPIDAMLKEEEVSGKEIENTGLIIPALKKPTSNLLGNNDILPLSNLYSHLKRQQMEQQLIQQQQQQQQHLAMLQARQQLILQQQEAKFMQQHLMKQMQPLDLYLQQQQQQQQLARQFQQNYNKYDQMSLINQRKIGGQEVPDMLASHPVFQYNNMLLAQQQQAGLNPHVLSGLNQRLNFNRQAENDLEVLGKNLEAEKITKIPELKFEDTLIKREEAVSDGSSKPPPSRKKNSISSQEDNKKSQKSSTIESTPVNQADNNKESGRARRKNRWQMIAEQQAQDKKGNEGMDFGELDPIQIARSNQAYIEGVSEEKCTDNDFLLKVMVTDDPLSLGHENPRHEFKVITEYNLENRTIHTGAKYQANVPVISLKPSRPVNTRKKPLEPLWDPSAISKDELNGYFGDLCKSFNCKKINQERALKLLKRKNYKREKVKVNISKNEKFYSSFLAVPDTAQEMQADGQSAQERPSEQ